jgi:hypothetical protein
VGGNVILTLPCIFHWRFFIQNIDGGVKITLPPMATGASAASCSAGGADGAGGCTLACDTVCLANQKLFNTSACGGEEYCATGECVHPGDHGVSTTTGFMPLATSHSSGGGSFCSRMQR